MKRMQSMQDAEELKNKEKNQALISQAIYIYVLILYNINSNEQK